MGLRIALWLVVAAAASGQGRPAGLERAIHLYENLEDANARAAFAAVLAASPPGEVAAVAHLYLGLIAFNNIRPDEARAEFRRALENNVAIELPVQVSPKARLAFDAVRQSFARDVEAPLTLAPAQPTAGPEPATTAALPEITRPAPTKASRSHALSWVLGSVGVATAAAAIYGGLQVSGFNSMVGAANAAAPGTSATTEPQLSSGRSSAQFWAVGWPVGAALAAAGLLTAVLVW